MLTFFYSYFLAFFSELGDKSQILSLVLAARFGKPFQIMAGITISTVLNCLLASYCGSFVKDHFPELALKLALACLFTCFGMWLLIPKKEPEKKEEECQWGPLITSAMVFFFAEMGDKSQIATFSMGTKFDSPFIIAVGAALGMCTSDGIVIYFGQKFTDKVPILLLQRFAGILFILSGVYLFAKL